MLGCTVISVHGTDLVLSNGMTLRCEVEGDCCSRSYFTEEDQFKELEGAIIHDVEERHGKSHDGLNDAPDADCTRWHFLVFTTNRGHVTIDWRNESNGYYDGTVFWTKP